MSTINFLSKHRPKSIITALTATFFSLSGAQTAQADDQIHILGWLEHARIMSVNLRVDAKLDTGAKTSAIHAEILSRDSLSETQIAALEDGIDEDEEAEEDVSELSAEETAKRPKRVVFRITNEDGEERILEREIVRYVSIKKRGGGVEVRPVVELDICIAGIKSSGEVSLADRQYFNYPLLVGRDMLESGKIAVNPDVDYTASARCSSR